MEHKLTIKITMMILLLLLFLSVEERKCSEKKTTEKTFSTKQNDSSSSVLGCCSSSCLVCRIIMIIFMIREYTDTLSCSGYLSLIVSLAYGAGNREPNDPSSLESWLLFVDALMLTQLEMEEEEKKNQGHGTSKSPPHPPSQTWWTRGVEWEEGRKWRLQHFLSGSSTSCLPDCLVEAEIKHLSFLLLSDRTWRGSNLVRKEKRTWKREQFSSVPSQVWRQFRGEGAGEEGVRNESESNLNFDMVLCCDFFMWVSVHFFRACCTRILNKWNATANVTWNRETKHICVSVFEINFSSQRDYNKNERDMM